MLHEETITFSWEIPEFEYTEKTKRWYYIVGGVAVIGIILSIIFANYLFAFLLLVGGFLMITLAGKQPNLEVVEISNHGIHITGVKNPYTNIDGFWILRNKENQYILLFHVMRNINPIVSIQIHPDINPMELREYLLNHLEEEEIKEPMADRIIRKIGF